VALALNNNGQVAGFVHDQLTPRAVIFENGGVIDLSASMPAAEYAESRAVDINDNGQALITRRTYFDISERSYFYDKGVATDLGQLSDSRVFAQALITRRTYFDVSERSYFYADGVATDLGQLTDARVYAHALNNAGLVIGTTGAREGFVWQNGVMYDLNTLVGGLDGWRIQDALAINENHQIAAYACRGFSPGSSGGECGTLLLSTVAAVPEPSTYAMVVGGLGLLGFAARRRRPAAQV
jgi:probable HAF family extracellular repeat protein